MLQSFCRALNAILLLLLRYVVLFELDSFEHHVVDLGRKIRFRRGQAFSLQGFSRAHHQRIKIAAADGMLNLFSRGLMIDSFFDWILWDKYARRI